MWGRTGENAVFPITPSNTGAEPPNRRRPSRGRRQDGSRWVGSRLSGVRWEEETRRRPALPSERERDDQRNPGRVLPAWLAEKAPVGGAVFPGRTAGNDAYQPPADPPRQALSSCPAKCSRFLFLPPASRAISRSRISYYGIKEAEERRSTS